MEQTNQIRKRSEIPVEDTWKTEDLYPTDEAWEQELATLAADKETLTACAGHLADSAQRLFSYLQIMEQTNIKAKRLANYCMRKGDEDTRNAQYQAMTGKFISTAVALDAATSFETPEIMAISDEALDSFYATCPELERYRRYLTNLRRRKEHVLSAAEEKLLASTGEMAQAPDKIYGMLTNADLTFPDAVDSDGKKHPLSQGTFAACQENADRQLRKSAYENLYDGFSKFKNTAAGLLDAQNKQL